MDFGHLFSGFLEPVAIGVAAVLAIIGIVRLRIPRRALAPIQRKSPR
jgi:hypothetical protein